MAMKVMTTLERISPSKIVIAEPSTGRKAKKPIQAPRPAIKRSARSRSFCLTCRYFSNHSTLPSRPTP